MKNSEIIHRFRWIPAGRFKMGSPEGEPDRWDDEGPQHEVTLSKGYWLADTTCTQALWTAVMGDNPSGFQDPAKPVERVSWAVIQAFIARLNQAVQGLKARLPTESEWEHACRAGTMTPFSFGDNISPEQVNYNGNHPYNGAPQGEYRESTVAVKSLPPNPWGLYEMHGNVWEWCQDTWHDSYQGAPVDGSAWEVDKSGSRVLRGGSWNYSARWARSAFRFYGGPDSRSYGLGFRLARGQETGEAEPGLGWGTPAWASDSGVDEFGYWVEFSV